MPLRIVSSSLSSGSLKACLILGRTSWGREGCRREASVSVPCDPAVAQPGSESSFNHRPITRARGFLVLVEVHRHWPEALLLSLCRAVKLLVTSRSNCQTACRSTLTRLHDVPSDAAGMYMRLAVHAPVSTLGWMSCCDARAVFR
jgi:hypothetical protein